MGCICSKDSSNKEKVDHEYAIEKEWSKSSVQLVAPSLSNNGVGMDGSSIPRLAKANSQIIRELEEKNNRLNIPKSQHQRSVSTISSGFGEQKPLMSRILSVQHHEGEYIDVGWPLWLSSVAGEAIKGWVPRRANSFEKLHQIGQGAYSSVHKARDLETGKYVALKKVRFSSGDPESVRFMAREIYILRQLDHPNILKLEGLVTSRKSTSLYLVFEYMEHDLTGLASRPGLKFTESQIKCYMKQLLCGLDHCHSKGVLHRDIKGSNLLIDNKGNLKIGDFGLATIYEPQNKQPLTSRVVTLWYRAPELLLGATDYGAGIDMWSVGCILAELLVGKPIMPGRTEVEQMHKIFKLCGSPSEDYWKRTKLPHATSFKPQRPYKRQITDTFKNFSSATLALIDKLLSIEPQDRGSAASALKSEFFTTNPLPCDPSNLPKFPPSKEFDAKRRDKEAIRKNTEAIKVPVTVSRGAKNARVQETPNYIANGDLSLRGKSSTRMYRHKYQSEEDDETHNKRESSSISLHNGYASSLIKRPEVSSRKNNVELLKQRSHLNHGAVDLSNFSIKKEQDTSGQETGARYVPKRNRIHCSGPLVPPGGNIDDMLREHERLMQDVFRSVKKTNL